MSAHSDDSGEARDQSADEAENAWPSTVAGDTDNESISSWETGSDDGEELETPVPPQALRLGLNWILTDWGYTDYDDYDVVTVHGARDDPQTVWKSGNSDSTWIQEEIFDNLGVRQLDYVYDTGNSARIYDQGANGINMEANALLDHLARSRDELMPTERHRPILWICHDLGGTIVKQALINAIHNQPPAGSGPEDDPECEARLRRIYRRLPVLTSMIIFLACPHGNESKEELEDQLADLLSLPGPPLRTRVSQKVVNLSRQVERINLEFLETKILDRAVIINITTVADDERATNPIPPVRVFSMQRSAMLQNIGAYTMEAGEWDHLELVRGRDREERSTSWRRRFHDRFNVSWGYNLKTRYAHFNVQNTLLSLSPPTQVNKYRFSTEGRRSDLVSWIMEHDVLERHLHQHLGPKTVYLHAGRRGSRAADMTLVSRQFFTAYDLAKREANSSRPCYGCFYFEFSQHDSRRAGIKAMILSLVRTYACRLWNDEDDYLKWFAHYLGLYKSCSLQVLIHAFLELYSENSIVGLTLIFGRIDQCDDGEFHVLLRALLERQSYSDRMFKVIITTNGPEDAICGMLPANTIISLDDYPLLEDEYLLYSDQSVGAKDRMRRLLARRPEFAGLQSQLSEIFGSFNKLPDLQDMVLEWLAEYHGTSNHEPSEILREAAADAHQKLFQRAIDQVSAEKQRIMAQICDWIKYAAEPLTLEILSEAVRYSLPEETARLHLRGHEEFRTFLEQFMRGIVSWDGRDLKFSDEIFYNLSGTAKFHDERDKTCRSHGGIAAACLHYLLGTEGLEMLNSLSVEKQGMDDLEWVPIALPRYSLVSYAVRFWPAHYRAACDHQPTDLALRLLQDMTRRAAWTEAVYVVSNPFTRIQREYLSSLPYMAMLGLDDLVHREIQNEQGNNGLNHDCWLAVIEAARNGQGSTVALLLEHTNMDDASLREALEWATRYGGGEALDYLVSAARKLEDFCWPAEFLELAAVHHIESPDLALVQAGYDWSAEDISLGVEATTITGHGHLLNVLIGCGRLDPKLHLSCNGESALLAAAQSGNPTLVQLLLDAGASAEDDDELATMLYDVIARGHHKALELLIDAKVFPSDVLKNRIPKGSDPTLPIFLAARRGYIECIRVLVDAGVNPNATYEDGGALYQAMACQSGRFEACRVLLENGADPNDASAERPRHEHLLLLLAIETGDKALVRLLLDYGAKINVGDIYCQSFDTPLLWAINYHVYDIMEMLFERGADANFVSECNQYYRGSYSPLFAAAKTCLRGSRFIKALINRGANVQWSWADGWTVLHAAFNSAEALSLLLQHGLDINATANDGRTTLILAVENKVKDSVQVLLNQTDPKADLELATKVGYDREATALHRACECYDSDVLKLLLEAGADVNCQRIDGESPLGLLLDSGGEHCEDAVKMILKRRPNLELSNEQGETILHKIKSDTSLSVVMRLVEAGAPVNTVDELGQTPLAIAVRDGNFDVARYLTTVKGVQCNVCHPEFGSILHMAVRHKNLEMVQQLIRTGADHSAVHPESGETVLYSAISIFKGRKRRDIIRYLVEEAGVDVNDPGGKRVYPLVRAIYHANEKSLVKYLLRHGARPDKADDCGRTAAHWATERGELDLLKLFIEFGADLSVADILGRTPLHVAAAQRHLRLVKYIYENLPQDADNIEIADVDGWTPLMWACKEWRRDYNSVALFLIDEYKADAHVRSKDGEWSPLKLAAFNIGLEDFVEPIAKRAEEQGAEEIQLSQDREIEQGTPPGRNCDGCFMACNSPTLICPECEFSLCFKCSPHKESLHDPEHTFLDIDEWQEQLDNVPGRIVYTHEDFIRREYGGDDWPSSEKEEESESETEENDDEEEEEEEEEDDDGTD